MLAASHLRRPAEPPTRGRSVPFRLTLILTTVVALLLGAPPAPVFTDELQHAAVQADPVPFPTQQYHLKPISFGKTEPHRLVQMYRWRHPDVSHERNVASFLYKDGGFTWAVVVPSVGRFTNNATTAPIEVFRQDPDAPNGWKRLTEDGELVNWREAGEGVSAGKVPTVEWTVDARPETKGAHAERIAYMYLAGMGVTEQVYLGMSEDIPCKSGQNQCRRRLQTPGVASGPRNWFPALPEMQYLDDGDKVVRLDEWAKAGRRIGPLLDLFSHGNSTIPAQGAAVAALNGAARDDLGGIDFSTLELRYLADPGDGQGLQYAFHADELSGQDSDLDAGRTAARHASDAFFVWLSLPRSTFWVNLNPSEPDRIVDPALATTDVGRILLEADLEMKRTEAGLIHPDTELGQEYWAAVDAAGSEPCMSARMWIVSGPATIYEEDGGLYILDAPLEVKMEAMSVGPPTQHRSTADPCHRPDGAPEPPHERFSRERVLPLIEAAVNQAPEYAELRQVYLSRVAAEWYRERSRHTDTSLSWLIDSGDVSAWPAMQEWSPQGVFDDYVESFTEGEFNVRREVQQGSELYEVTYFYGGVDLATVPLTGMDSSVFQADWADLPEAVGRAIEQPATAADGGVWLGGTAHPMAPEGWADSPTRRNNVGQLAMMVVAVVLVLIVGGVGITMVIVFGRGRPRPQPANPPPPWHRHPPHQK